MKRVLVIEDEPLIRDVLEEVLTEDGLNVEFARDGSEGIARALRVPPDAVVLDLMLPRMSGFEVLEVLRGARRATPVPIVVTTAKPHAPDRMRAFDLGADEFLLKPYELDALRAVLGRVLNLPLRAKFGRVRASPRSIGDDAVGFALSEGQF